MNHLALLLSYRDDERTRALVSGLSALDSCARYRLEGLQGGQMSCVLAAACLQMPQTHHIVVAHDKDEAAYLQNDLSTLTGRQDVLFFPDSFKKPAYFEHIHRNNVLMRTEVVNRLMQPNAVGVLVVTYPEALFEKVVAPAALRQHAIDIHVGERLDARFVAEVLATYGFTHEELVYDPGQFSVRGGIIDIFSYGNDFPYRIELFDDEVESIRLFDPNTQLSRRNLSRVTILPNINTQFGLHEKTSLLDLLAERTVLWACGVQYIVDKLQYCFDRALNYADRLREQDLTEPEAAALLQERAFLLPSAVVPQLVRRPVVEWGHEVYYHEASTLLYRSKPQPVFNKNFQLLIRSLQDNELAGYQNYIFADNPKQLERLRSIFNDLQADVRFVPVQAALQQGFVDTDLRIACYTDHQIFDRYHKYKLRSGYEKAAALTMRMLRDLQPGDFVTHIDHGIGRFAGLQRLEINGHVQEAVRLVYQGNDMLYVSVNSLHKLSKYVGKDGTEPKLHKLGSDVWARTKLTAKRKVKDIAKELIKLYALRRATPGFAFPPDNYLQTELEASFIYEDTPDQAKATEDVKRDMMREYPMDRLLCGDVGFGKTEIAVRAAFRAVCAGKQVAILVPTTILALQHAKTFRERMRDFGVQIEYLNRFRSTKEKNDILQRLQDGRVEIVIGTHILLGDKIKFKDLGLLIVDEEQKFGVAAKEKLRHLKANVDTLTLTATPIPRTLQFSLMAARDLSVIHTPPPNRQPIHTEIRLLNEQLIQEAVYYEIHRGGQVFFIHNRVSDLEEVAQMLGRLCPDIDITTAHGQMPPDLLEERLVAFIEGQHDVLVSTNIIETGLDIPNANTIIINNAHHFGLSDLHQLRGRVGRSNRKAFCYLFCPPLSALPADARKRLQTLEQFSDLGSGFHIAMRDLDIRGAGNLLGGEQSGFIVDIGYATYQKILDEAVQELKETDFKDLFAEELGRKKEYVREVTIETDLDMHIPEHYVSSAAERLLLYTELDKIENEKALTAFAEALRDRFGKMPRQVEELLNGLRLRWLCRQLGFERLTLKDKTFRCYFISNPQSPYYETAVFQDLVRYLQQRQDTRCYLRQSTKSLYLTLEKIGSLTQAGKALHDLAVAIGLTPAEGRVLTEALP